MFTKKAILRNIVVATCILFTLADITAMGQPLERLGHCNFSLTGTASGGKLILAENLNRNAMFVSLETKPGESASIVAQRLAEAINSSNAFNWGGAFFEVIASGDTITLLGSCAQYMSAGTEVGLGIPKPPSSLSCNFDSESKSVTLRWINPSEDYDSIKIVLNWDHYDHRGEIEIPGTSESYVLDLNKRSINLVTGLDVWLFGSSGGVPSNAAAIRLDGNSQEELFGIPFANDIAPNWKAWSLDTAPNMEKFTCSIKNNLTAVREKGKRYNSIKTNDAKPFKQVLKTPAQGGTIGIWRKFLGLTPGHTYKLSARLSTLEMSANDTEWSFSMHAVADRTGKKELTSNQMAGLEALPSGETGPQVGRIAEHGPGKLTAKNEYVIHSAEITLPEDSDSITVWLRHTGKGTSRVGFDWIKLEDLSMTGNESEK